MRSLRDDSRGVARVLRELHPDVVCLQEAPRLFLWRTSRWLLARRAGLRVVTRGRSCGVVVLCAPGVERLGAYVVVLPKRPGLHRRAVAVASVRLDGTVLAAASTHLDLDAAARLASAQRVRAALPDGPLVLAGDVNEQPDGPAWEALGLGLTDARDGLGATFPARDPQRWIDGVWVSPGLRVIRAEVVPAGRVSDHLPICVDLELSPGSGSAGFAD